ncbi:DUF5719 family protein [Nocardioides mesophilus]|uniref:Uncharacterized protein n=1 Tax=Nocardioides mesophilus TaxID=433659 RepID=A0A7G9RDE6_9ACTN|nr:DUF5719 family protein [Nocardioides mesophilus]QNN53621.1 hypothetical protein H9L09_04135 [Nocardioides mesophilus]
MSSAQRVPGSRRATGPRRPVPGGGAVLGVLLLALAAAAVLLTGTAEPAPRQTAGARTLVDSALLACPSTQDVRLGRVTTRVVAGLADVRPAGEPLGDSGELLVGEPGRAGEPLDLARGALEELPSDPTGPAPVLDASGDLAAGLFGDRTDSSDTAGAVAACRAPRGSWWFTGAGASLDHASDLVMTNLDPGQAVVDVRLHGPEGTIDTVGTRDIPIGAGETVTLSLADLAPQTEELTVEVAAARGRVSAAVLDRYAARPGAAAGLEWLPATQRPSRNLRLAGIPSAGASRTLLVTNPSELEALVEVEVVGANGSFAPTGLDQVSVAPGAVESVPLDDVLPAGEPLALRVRSRVPLVAAVRTVGTGPGADNSYAGPVLPLLDPAAVPVPARATTTVQLSAGSQPARATLTGYAADGKETGSDEVAIGPGATAAWEPPTGSAYVVVTPLEGSVYGAATYAGRGILAQTPLAELPMRVRTPSVRPGPR